MAERKDRPTKFSRFDADVRRRSLIEATARCLVRDGFEGASVRRICQEAGVSAGLLRHYFDGKDDLVATTYDTMAADLARITHEKLTATPGPAEARLDAFFVVSFTPEFISEEALLAWVAFWRLIRTDRRFKEMHRRVYAAYRQDLADVLAEIAADRGLRINPRLAALSLTGLIDGLWLELSLDPTAFTPEEAIDVCRNWVDSFMGRRPVGHFDADVSGEADG